MIDDEQDKAANIADLVFPEEQSSYLAGVAAAKATKKNHIGFIGGVDIPLIHKFEAGFSQGAKSVNPSIKIESQYLTQTRRRVASPAPTRARTRRRPDRKGADMVYPRPACPVRA